MTRRHLLNALFASVVIGASATFTYVTVASRFAPAAPLGARFTQVEPGVQKFRVFVFLDPFDCRGNLSFLSIFQRDTANFKLENLLLLGSRDSLSTMREELDSRFIRTPLLASTRPQRDAFRLLGARGTPFIVVVDPDDVVRLAMYSPPDMVTQARFHELMRALVDQGLTDPLVSPR